MLTGGLTAFDLDGTLIDSATDIASAASALVVELGGAPLGRAQVVAMVGEGAGVLVQRALTAAGLAPDTPGALARYLEIYDRRLMDTTRLYAGVADALRALDPLAALAVLTNKPRAMSERVLTALGVRGSFVEVIGGDGPWPRKPDPAGLLALAVHARGGPIVYVGDSPVDADTAARAAVPFVLARYGFGAEGFTNGTPTPHVAESPAELPRVIDAARRAGSRHRP